VTAEGVDREAVLDMLIDLRCDMAQGFLIGRPMPADEFMTWCRESRWGVA
jgi:EAL domain-containing protein (putative c-di-GMP-specific phosphodiesterase class I)